MAAHDRAQATAHTVRIIRAVGMARRPRKVLPRQIPPRAIAREYASALLEVVARIRTLFDPFMDALPRLIDSASHDRRLDSVRLDAGEGKRIRELLDIARAKMSETIKADDVERLARKFAVRTATHQRIQLGNQVRAALGADVFLQDRALRPLTEAFVDANVGLVTNIGDKLASDLEATAMRALQTGQLHGDLAEELQAKFGFAEDRTKLIARDQIGKMYGQINSARQREIGVTRFVWRTVKDERVRDAHAELDGEIFSYDDPPEEGLPGEPINCRCFAEPVLDDILALADE